MSKHKNKEKYLVTDNSHTAVEDIKWDKLIELHIENKTLITNSMNILDTINKTFNNIIESDAELTNVYVGIVKSFSDLTKELIELLIKHSVVKDEEGNVVNPTEHKEGKVSYAPYVGNVNLDNEKERELYIILVMGYAGINEKITNIAENNLITLLALIQEKAKEKGIDLNTDITTLTKTNNKGDGNG